MENSNNAAPKAKKILAEVLKDLKADDALESHLPKEVTSLDKAGLLAVIYRLVARIPD